MYPRENIRIQQQIQGRDARTIRFSIENARLQYKQREFAESILNYVAVLRSQPLDTRGRYLFEFLESLRAYLHEDTNEARIRDILQISTSIYGTEFRFWRLEAEYQYKRGKLLKSLEVFKKALDHTKNDLERVQASTSIENIKSNLFDAWHWRMINDGKRNTKFAAAIEAALAKKPQAQVLDIGCGSGIYSMIAARNGNSTFACDQNEVMVKIAHDSFELNELEIGLYEKHSKKLDIGFYCDVLVTETVDCAIFGERIVETILDAKERLLESDAILIPNKAVALFSLVEADAINQENLYESESLAIISHCCNLAEQDDGSRIIPPSPYTCCYLDELPNGYRLLSSQTEGLAVDFTNTHQLKQIKNDRFLTEVIIYATEKGMASAVCVWFKLNLFEEHEICTEPKEGHCWQQTIFPFYPPQQLSPGDPLRFEVFIKNSALRVQPIGAPFIGFTKEVLRASPWMDLTAMNDQAIRAFFLNATNAYSYSQVLDCTDFLIRKDFSIASGQSLIRYIGRNALSLDKAICEPGGAILFWPFSNQGTLMDDYLSSIIELRARSLYTTLIPCQIVLKGCLITSEQLCRWSRLLDDQNERTTTYCGLDLSAMDEYRVSHYHEIQTSTLAFQQISKDEELFTITFQDEREEQVSNYVKQLTKVMNECIFTCTQEGVCHAVLYWFEIGDPLGNAMDLRKQTQSHLPSAFILPTSKHLKAGNQLKSQFSLLHGNILFHWVKDVLFL